MKKNMKVKNTTMDTFIVPSNGKMQEVMDWYKDNKEWLGTLKFMPPFKDGIIEFQEEEILLEFHAESEFVYKMIIYMQGMQMASYEYYIKSDEIKNLYIVPNVRKEAREKMMFVLNMDNTPWKTKMKWLALMQFALHFRKYVKAEKKEKSNNQSVRTPKTQMESRVRTLGQTYYVDSVPQMKNGKRTYTKPDHAVEFRPTYRHYKNGKVIPVKGGVRYADKGNDDDKKGKTYKL